MLRAGFEEQPLRVLNLCRVRWGTVQTVHSGGTVEVLSRPLEWDGHLLRLGEAQPQTAAISAAQARTIRPGGTVSLHWDWVCETLSPQQAGRLSHYTRTQLHLANASRG
jgi:hypothetical protein